jgi:hypothetical protein
MNAAGRSVRSIDDVVDHARSEVAQLGDHQRPLDRGAVTQGDHFGQLALDHHQGTRR